MPRRMQQILGTLVFATLFNIPVSSAQESAQPLNLGASEGQRILASNETLIQEPVVPEFPPTYLPSWEIGQFPLAMNSQPVPPLPVFLYTKAELAQQRAEARTQLTKKFIEYVNSHKNPKITFMDKTWTGRNGRIVCVGDQEFSLIEDSSKKVLTFSYADISKLDLMPSAGARAQQTFKDIGLVLLLIPLLPLVFLTGWDGC